MKKKDIKALVLISGGLDSVLAAWLIRQQGIEIKGLIFESVFFDSQRGVQAAKQLNIPYEVIDISKELLEAIESPEHGFGGAANPCIDCHLIMLKKSKEILDKENFNFVATGEVIGQRPFSQNKEAMELLATKSGLNELLVRPLSAQKLEPTGPEKKGWLNREELFGISGRSRKTQIDLANKANLSYQQPAGGCMLTEKGFGEKVFDLKDHFSNLHVDDAKLLKVGRHFWQGDRLVIIGKDEDENKRLEELAQPSDKIVYPANFIGPTALIRGKNIDQSLTTNTKHLILKHTPPHKQDVFKQPLLFFGSSAESVLILKELLKADIPVGAVITKPDRQCGRGQKVKACPLGQFAKKQNLTTFKLEKLSYKTRQKVERKLKYKPHWGIVAVYGNIIPKSWLNWFNILLNIHPSLLPKWRGAAPTIRTIEAGEKETGWTIFKLVEAMDAGPIITQEKTSVKSDETAGQLTNRLFQSAAQKIVPIFSDLYQTNQPQFWVMDPQSEKEATYASKIKKDEAEINWAQPAEEIVNQVRAFNPWPGAYTKVKIDGKKERLKIWQAHLENKKLVPDTVHLSGKCRCQWEQFSHDYNLSLEDLKKT